MRNILHLYALLLCVFLPARLNAAKAPVIAVREIPQQNKLPINAVHRIFQDSNGFMWYGTFDGLCRFDGYNVKVFRADMNRPGLLRNNYITYITEDHEKQLWIGTMDGLYTLKLSTCEIKEVNTGKLQDRQVFTISTDRDGTIWASLRGHLLHLHPQGTLLGDYPININGKPDFVYFVYQDRKGHDIVSILGNGMYLLDKKNNRLTPYRYDERVKDIERIFWDEQHNCYWLATWRKGIVRFRPDAPDGTYYAFQPLPMDCTGKPSGNVFHMVRDDAFGYLWVTTDTGLYAYRILPDGTLEQVNTDAFLPRNNKMLYEVIKDRTGRLWVSAFDSESFMIEFREEDVKTDMLHPLQKRIQAKPVITSLAVDRKGNYWFVQERYGLCLYQPDNGQLTHYSDAPEVTGVPLAGNDLLLSSRHSDKVWTVAGNQTIYGLEELQGDIRISTKIPLQHRLSSKGTVTSIFEDGAQQLWIGTSEGCFAYDTEHKTLIEMSGCNGAVTGFAGSGNNRLWLAIAGKGIYRTEKNGRNLAEEIKLEKSLTGLSVTSDGILWTGTAGGEIFSYNTATKVLTDMTGALGLDGDRINSVMVDEYNYVWVMTHQEIRVYNPKNGAYFAYHTGEPGFSLKRLIAHTYVHTPQTQALFGGVGGIASFNISQRLEQMPGEDVTRITDIRLDGKSVWNGDTCTAFKNDVLQIPPDVKDIEIRFSSLNYSATNRPRYACRLEGKDKEWTVLEKGKNVVSYNHLPKGQYTLYVKSTDENGVWSTQEAKVQIERLPAFYETYWAWLVYVLLAGGTFWIGCRMYLHQKDMKNKQEAMEHMSWVFGLEKDGKSQKTKATSLDEQMVDKASHIVEEHLPDTEFDVQMLADNLNMSRSTLVRKFRNTTGMTPSDFIKGVRMKHAAAMLANPKMTVAEVAVAVGYNDRKHFSEIFKKVFGLSPSEYQKKQDASEMT